MFVHLFHIKKYKYIRDFSNLNLLDEKKKKKNNKLRIQFIYLTSFSKKKIKTKLDNLLILNENNLNICVISYLYEN